MKIALKELRETLVWLRILYNKNLTNSHTIIEPALIQNEELIRIFVKSIRTAESGLSRQRIEKK